MAIRITMWTKFILRCVVASVIAAVYLINKQLLDFTADKSGWALVFIIAFYLILMGELIVRFLPGKLKPIGMRKHLKAQYMPTQDFLNRNCELNEPERKKLKTSNKRALIILILYLLLSGIWYTLFFLKIFGVPELVMVMMFYYVADLFCVHIYCPFRKIFLRHRCCTVCRIYNWDAWMLFSPMFIIIHPFSTSLSVLALIYSLTWEYMYFRHPERFLDTTNENLKCKNCKHHMCKSKLRVK